jgi:hypothetical protein
VVDHEPPPKNVTKVNAQDVHIKLLLEYIDYVPNIAEVFVRSSSYEIGRAAVSDFPENKIFTVDRIYIE